MYFLSTSVNLVVTETEQKFHLTPTHGSAQMSSVCCPILWRIFDFQTNTGISFLADFNLFVLFGADLLLAFRKLYDAFANWNDAVIVGHRICCGYGNVFWVMDLKECQ